MVQSNLSDVLLRWFDDNQRDLPWRTTKEPYLIWLSEVILQQTQVAQGLPYYLNFRSQFPTVFDLAKANEQEVLKAWEGLGYYSRARNLHKTAIEVATHLEGDFPKTATGLMQLPGIGPYTANAVASICYDEKVAVVDGNVYRVLSRYFGVSLPINESSGINYFKTLSQEILPDQRIGDYNQAVMEFGALICTPKQPSCCKCPLNSSCAALANKEVINLPVKTNKVKVRKRYFNYLIYLDLERKTPLNKRLEKDIWQHLYEFPLIESNGLLGVRDMRHQVSELFKYTIQGDLSLINAKPIVHKLTHQHIFANFWLARADQINADFLSLEVFEKYPMPQLIVRFLKNFRRHL